MKDYDKHKESSYLEYWHVDNPYGWAMSQKLPPNDFKWLEDISEFNEDFIKSFNYEVMKDIFLKLMFNILNMLHDA